MMVILEKIKSWFRSKPKFTRKVGKGYTKFVIGDYVIHKDTNEVWQVDWIYLQDKSPVLISLKKPKRGLAGVTFSSKIPENKLSRLSNQFIVKTLEEKLAKGQNQE